MPLTDIPQGQPLELAPIRLSEDVSREDRCSRFVVGPIASLKLRSLASRAL